MASLLRAPYPAPEPGRAAWATAIGVGVFIFLFLFVFQPFGLHHLPIGRRLGATLGYGAVTMLVLLAFFDGWPRLAPRRFANERWTFGRHVLFLSLAVTVIAGGNLLWSRTMEFFPLTLAMFGYMAAITFVVGLFPAFAFTALSYIRFLRRYDPARAAVAVMPETVLENAEAALPAAIVLIAENEKDRLELRPDDLLYLESADNYTQVVYRRPADGTVTRTLLRGSLTRFEQQIARPDVRRCHRSYVVNLRQVERISGNAQGYKLHLTGVESAVPVARRYAAAVVK